MKKMDNKTLDIKNYLHLYLGCEIQFSNEKYLGNPEKLTVEVLHNIDYGNLYNGVKPILRPLNDMTKNESEFLSDAAWEGKSTILMNAEITKYLLSKNFDLFGLIEAGLAIDKSKSNG